MWIFFLIIFIITLSIACYTSITIYYAEKYSREQIDAMLLAIAYGAHNIVGDQYHDAIKDSTSISQQEYLNIKTSLEKYAQEVKVREVYSYIDYNGELRWTSGNLTTDLYFDTYKDNEAIMENIYFKPFRDNKPEYFTYDDFYGSVRSVFIPFTTPNGKKYIVGADYNYHDVQKLSYLIIIVFSPFGLLILLVAIALAYIFVNQISKPLKNLVTFTNELIINNFQLSENSQNYLQIFSINYRDEVGKLSEAFLTMQISLKKYIIDLRDTTIAKEGMEGQLRIASAIQLGMVPKQYPAFPNYKQFNIYGQMHPAKEVGGDLYNYFMIDKDHLCFTIGDVSGKGIPAALFMAMTNTLVKAIALTGLSPADILFKVKNELCKDNDQFIFITRHI